MPSSRHQQSRSLFQALWLLIVAALLLTGAPVQVWLGLLVAALASALLLKRAACSFTCPLFPVGELLWRTGERLFGRSFAPPFWLDLLLRTAKYLLLGALLWTGFGALATTPPPLSVTALALFAAALLVLSLFFPMPFCRYLCPAGALLGLVSAASPVKIRRNPRHCVRCHKCSNRCPASLPVMLRETVRSPECFACQRCVDVCPAPGALAFATPGKRPVPAWVTGIVLSGVLIAGIVVGMLT